jgi:membrane-anchored mycosin MYCP
VEPTIARSSRSAPSRPGLRRLSSGILAAALGTAAAAVALAPAPALAAAQPTQLSAQCLAASAQRYSAVPWAQQQLAAQRVWNLTQGAGQIVAVVDSGVSGTAPGLASAVLPGRNVLTGASGDRDCLGHGTFTAGLIAARPVPGTGLVGVAPQARILPVDAVSPARAESAEPATSSSATAAGIVYAVDSGASVVDVSTAATPGPSAALQQAVAYAEASNVLVIAPVSVSAGANVASYPADYPGVVAVSAVDAAGAPVAAAGPGAHVDLAAPGVALISARARGGGEVSGSGAALATAFVAGTAALVRSYYPRLPAADVAQRLEDTADRPGTTLPDPQLGYGIIDPYTAVTTVLPGESGGRQPAVTPARAIYLPPQRRPDTWPRTGVLIVCGFLLAGLLAGGTAARVIRHGRRRGWRSSFSAPPRRNSDPAGRTYRAGCS